MFGSAEKWKEETVNELAYEKRQKRLIDRHLVVQSQQWEFRGFFRLNWIAIRFHIFSNQAIGNFTHFSNLVGNFKFGFVMLMFFFVFFHFRDHWNRRKTGELSVLHFGCDAIVFLVILSCSDSKTVKFVCVISFLLWILGKKNNIRLMWADLKIRRISRQS